MLVPAGSAPQFWFGEHLFRFLINGDKTNGSYSALEFESPHGSGPQPHIHADSEEHFLVLEGELRFTVDDQTFVAWHGDFVHVPRATTHAFEVLSERARVFASFSPAGEEEMFMAAATRQHNIAF
jgi:quercetin dioxygenase-like cupin family protein